ncbi:MAG: hypothetical protein NTV34_13560 [Proteobacteria bacterium]|nr:hypothetical protein [Pseudomonadota bacterium]
MKSPINQTGKPLKRLTKIEVVGQRGALSPFLVHLTRSGRITLPSDIYGLREDDSRMINARKNLQGIVEKSVIKAISPFGYFNYKVRFERFGKVLKNPDSKVQRRWLCSVCFTETPIEHVHVQMREISGRNLHFEPYGLAFWESAIRKGGGNPLFYFDSTNQAVIASLDAVAVSDDCERFKNTLPLYESFGPSLYSPKREVDFRWEREWRVVGDFAFTASDVAFAFLSGRASLKAEQLSGAKT